MATNNSPTTWQSPKRPDWVEKINTIGGFLDTRSIVPLDAENLIATATKNTGLSDFGSDDWREPLDILTKSLEEEADLNLLGRILTRADLLRTLEGRLHIEHAYQQHPEIENQVIEQPLIITGASRTGTSALYNLLSADPDNRVPLLWETWFPHPAPETATYDMDPRIEQADKIALQWDEITPEFPLLHEQRGYLPVEDNYLLMLALRAPNAWLGKTPSYIKWLGAADLTPSVVYMKRTLKYLQWKHKRTRWVLKSPALLVPLTLIFEAFPDARLVYTHRDPAKITASVVHLMNTVFWIRSDNYLSHQNFFNSITDDEIKASMLDGTIKEIETNTIPKKQIFNLMYKDFINDNIEAVHKVYDFFNIESSSNSFTSMEEYVKGDKLRRQGLKSFKYENPSVSEIERLREVYAEYQSYFNIPNEL